MERQFMRVNNFIHMRRLFSNFMGDRTVQGLASKGSTQNKFTHSFKKLVCR